MSSKYKNVIVNFISLVMLQAGNYIVPLVLTPYIIVKIGVEEFGVLSFAIAISMFFRAVISYGFDLSGTKIIAESSSDNHKVSNFFQDIIYAKTCLALLCFIVMVVLLAIIPAFNTVKDLLFVLFILGVADVIFPVWFYQGMQKMKAITILKLSGKFLFVGLTIFVVESSRDTLYIPLIEGLVTLLTSLISFFWAVNRYNLVFQTPELKRIIDVLKSSWYVFVSKIAVLFYTRSNVVLLGLLSSSLMVGYYSIAEKIYMAIREMLNPLIQAVFPYLSKLRVKNIDEYNKLVRIFFLLFLGVLFLSAITLYFFREQILAVLLKEDNIYIQNILSVFSVCLLFSVGSVLSTILVIEDRGQLLSKITLSTVVVNMIVVYPLASNYEALGLAICFLIVQIAHFIMQLLANRNIFSR